MCGICGIVGIPQPEAARPVLQRMLVAMEHRGPDDEGMLLEPGLALGMRRLSIIDIAGGHQPVFNEDHTVAVVLNGEIYNFRELRTLLERQGHRFRTNSDTEAIVHAYEEWGTHCVDWLRGMFAFAVYDRREAQRDRPDGPRLLLVRDRLGIKPLYYTVVDGALLFASEVRSLLASGCVPRALSSDALASYLHFGSVGEPMTLVEGIRSLPPGHLMVLPLDENCGAPQPERYWFPNPHSANQETSSRGESDRRAVAEHVRKLLDESVRLHLIADVPVGLFLSSGMDSTALAALAAQNEIRLQTFTIAFPEQQLSEAMLARRTAERFGTDHHEVTLTGGEMLARLDEAVSALDQPSMDGINTWFVSWAARQSGLKVALSGLGGDEIFGGYSSFRQTPRLQQLAWWARRTPGPLRQATAALVEAAGTARGTADAGRKLAAFWSAPEALPHPYFSIRTLFTPPQVGQLLTRTLAGGASPWRQWLTDAAASAAGRDTFGAVALLESRSYLVNTLLRDTDAVSMAHSLEVRVPFLDHPLVEFMGGLPGSVVLGGGSPKALLAEAMAGLLPPEVVQQRKRTFTLPWEAWLRGPLRPRVETGLAGLAPALRGVMDEAAVQAVWRQFLTRRTSWSRPWSLYALNEWARRHISE